MEQGHHTMSELFAQLGLPDDSASIRHFIAEHRPLSSEMRLFEAPFWSPSQGAFIKEKLREDSDWAVLIDSLHASLQEHPDVVSVAGADVERELQGEGNHAAGKRYDDAAQAFAQSGRVEAAARAAAPRTAQEALELREAEALGQSKARR
jgi:hypothetical protein